jgi:sterol 14-demethylase
VPLIEQEVLDYVSTEASLQGLEGIIDESKAMAGITILTAARTLQGDEVRAKLSAEFAELYHDLDLGFNPFNFIMPWAPLPHNRKRDAAHAKMREVYKDVIQKRRNGDGEAIGQGMVVMNCNYKDGRAVPDHDNAHMMITLFMAGQHTSSSASSWIILQLASRPDVTEEL